jgi:hypothetical protein
MEVAAMVWSGPPPQVGKVSRIDLVPLAKVRLSERAMFVPQTNEVSTEIVKGTELLPV